MKGLFTGKGLKHFTENPPLTASQLAELGGHKEIVQTLVKAESKPIDQPVKKEVAKETEKEVSKEVDKGPRVESGPSRTPITTIPPSDIPPPLATQASSLSEKPTPPPTVTTTPEIPPVLSQKVLDEEFRVDDVLKERPKSITPQRSSSVVPITSPEKPQENFGQQWKQHIEGLLQNKLDVKDKMALKSVLKALEKSMSEVNPQDKTALAQKFTTESTKLFIPEAEKAKAIVEAIQGSKLPQDLPSDRKSIRI